MSARLRGPLLASALLLSVAATGFAVTPGLAQPPSAATSAETEETSRVSQGPGNSARAPGQQGRAARGGAREAVPTPPVAPSSTPPAAEETAGAPAAGSSTTSSAPGTASRSAGASTGSPAPAAGTASSSPAATSGGQRPAAGAPLVPSGAWLSGAAGDGVGNGEYAAWRGTEVGIAGTWSDNNEAQVELWALQPGAELGSFGGSVDIAIGAIGEGETWEEAARGAYDDRWRASLTRARDLWAGRSGTLFIRFAHEMNGNWYPWSVDPGNADAFVQAWRHFRALQQDIFPQGQLVFCVNRESIGSDLDWRTIFPGSEHVDVMGVDYYNGWPYVSDRAVWEASIGEVDGRGAPRGLQAHLDFARSVGLPLAVPEWSGKASFGDSPAFIEGMHSFFAANAGGGAGQLLYEIQFNIDMHGNDYRLFGDTQLPASAETYRRLF
jgi:hypothetical protein